MHKCFSYPLKAENKEAFLHPGRLLGRGPQLYWACDPPPSLILMSAPPRPPLPPRRDSLDFPSLPQPLPKSPLRPLWPCPAPAPTLPPAAPGKRESVRGWEMDGEGACRERVRGRWMGRRHAGREQLCMRLAGVVMAWLGVCQSSCVVTGCTMVADIR